MPGRTLASLEDRFGFNGKQKDNETGNGNSVDFGARMYDTRIGRFRSLDPLTKVYIGFSPYSFPGNNPIRLIDLEGKGGGDPIGDASLLIPNFVIISSSRPSDLSIFTRIKADDIQNRIITIHSSAMGHTSGNGMPGGFPDEMTMDNKGVYQVAEASVSVTFSKVKNNDDAVSMKRVERVTTVTLDNDKVVSIDIQTKTTVTVEKPLVRGNNLGWSQILSLPQTAIQNSKGTFEGLSNTLKNVVKTDMDKNSYLKEANKALNLSRALDKGFVKPPDPYYDKSRQNNGKLGRDVIR